MKANEYAILERAVEEGVAYGWRRAHKYEENPSDLTLRNEIEQAVMNSICEVFNFADTSLDAAAKEEA